MEENKARKKTDGIFEWCETIAFSVAAALIVLAFGCGFSQVNGSSMYPTLVSGEQVFTRTFLYTPQRGDVITTDALIDYGKPLIKRVIALGGDTVRIDGETGAVYVNGEPLDETYLPEGTFTSPNDLTEEVVVPAGKVFVMGDNRGGSLDGRSAQIGFIDERDILGEVLYCVTPFANFRRIQ